MLNELTKMINEATGLTGKELEGAVFAVGLAVVDVLIETRANGKPQDDLYKLNNHLASRLHEVKQQIAVSN